MYEAHRKRPLPDSSDGAIYSPDVPVFRMDDGTELPQPWLLSLIRCAAPYAPDRGGLRHNLVFEVALHADRRSERYQRRRARLWIEERDQTSQLALEPASLRFLENLQALHCLFCRGRPLISHQPSEAERQTSLPSQQAVSFLGPA
jgi:hypothetical protein